MDLSIYGIELMKLLGASMLHNVGNVSKGQK